MGAQAPGRQGPLNWSVMALASAANYSSIHVRVQGALLPPGLASWLFKPTWVYFYTLLFTTG